MKKQYSFLLLLMCLVLPFSVSAQSSNINERVGPKIKGFQVGIPTFGYEYIDKSGYTVTMLLDNSGGVSILQVIKSQAFGETKFD